MDWTKTVCGRMHNIVCPPDFIVLINNMALYLEFIYKIYCICTVKLSHEHDKNLNYTVG